MKDNTTSKFDQEVDNLPGVATDVADDEKASAKAEKQATCQMNNNPRNTDMDNM